MKTRQGFVSNSSSSSFVLAFDNPIKNKEDLKNSIFPNGIHGIVSPYYDDDEVVSGEDAIDMIYDQIKDTVSFSSHERVIDALMSGWFEGYPDWHDRNDNVSRIESWYRNKFNKAVWSSKAPGISINYGLEWQRQNIIERCKTEKAARKFFKNIQHSFVDKVMYEVSFSDSTSREAAMEQGDVFSAIPHVKISHH